eukprot:1155097-Pelagomonas_calceolata.AAC.1
MNQKNLVEPNGTGITKNIGRVELAAIAAALTHTLPQTASAHFTNSTKKQILCPEKHRHHVQGDVLKTISDLAHTSQGHIFFYKVISHAEIAGNECADMIMIAKYQASLEDNNLNLIESDWYGYP